MPAPIYNIKAQKRPFAEFTGDTGGSGNTRIFNNILVSHVGEFSSLLGGSLISAGQCYFSLKI